jgi:predicted ATPase
MIHSLSIKGFKAVPYLATSALMLNHKQRVQFSSDKPNVIVGPNGAGKSALMTALALQTLSFYIGESAFDDQYALSNEARDFWSETRGWREEYVFLPGLTCETDNAPALYYRPGHIPGNDDSIGAAMMCGYGKQADVYWKQVHQKSSGQQSQELLKKVMAQLKGESPPLEYQYVHWRSGKVARDLSNSRSYVNDFDYKFEVLRNRYANVLADARPLVLMDEPEQSLDARAEAILWGQIAQADCAKVQVIVATHSLYPLMHPERFNLIEAVPGYIDEVRALM